MDVVCLACIVIILAMSYIFLRKEKGNYAMAILPLIFVPVAHLASGWAYKAMESFLTVNYPVFVFTIDIIALVIACLFFGISSTALDTRKARLVYCIMCGGFSALFTFALLKDIIFLV